MKAWIMIVEDDEQLGELLEYNLVRAGYEVSRHETGRAAMNALRRSRPDVVLLDLMLPDIDGVEVCRFVSMTPELGEIPIVVHTARATREDFDEVRAFGVAGFFTKPYSTEDVLRHVEKVLRTRAAARSQASSS